MDVPWFLPAVPGVRSVGVFFFSTIGGNQHDTLGMHFPATLCTVMQMSSGMPNFDAHVALGMPFIDVRSATIGGDQHDALVLPSLQFGVQLCE